MKKIIGLTEADLKRIVKRVIKENEMKELYRSTYDRAADKATEKGLPGLGDRFKEYGRRKGELDGDENVITIVDEDRGNELKILLPPINNIKYGYSLNDGKTHLLKIENVETLGEGTIGELKVQIDTEFPDDDGDEIVKDIKLKFEESEDYGNSKFIARCSNRKCAQRIVYYLAEYLDDGFDFNQFDERKLISGY